MSQIREATIRDQLAQDLSVIEEGLELVDTERYIPNPSGTRGFIDLLARDSRGRHVLIELKRSDAAARQALHETFKYIDGIKANLAARDDELRVLIVSTEWTELLVPFSVAVTQVKFDVEGYLLDVNEFGKPLSAQRVSPVPVQEDRLFSPWHEVALYTSELNMNRGVASYEASCSRKGVEHYVLVLLKAGEDRRRRELDSLFVRLNSIRPPDQQLTREEIAQKVPEHSWMIYFGPLQIRDEDLIRGIRDLTPPDELEDFEQTISEMSGDELSCTLQEHLLALDPVPDRDYIEIGYPAKLTRFLNDDGWRVIRILRYGNIRSNALLADETILAELQGEQGVTGQRYVKEFSGRPSVGQLSSTREELKECLADNPIWSSHLQIAMDDLATVAPDSSTRISVYNPSNTLLSIYLAVSREDGILYIPNYHVTTKGSATAQTIFGVLSGDGRKPSMKLILDKHFSGELSNLLMPLNWGGYYHEDRFVARDSGLTYRTFKVVVSSDDTRTAYELTQLGWEHRDKAPLPFDLFGEYLQANGDFVADVIDIFSSHWDGTMISFDEDDPEVILRT